MNPAQKSYIEDLLKECKRSKNDCKECKSKNVVPVSQFGYLEHCRNCGNWQASF
jgi:hypothetical protein